MVSFNVPLECTVNTWKKAILEIKVFSGNLILSVARRSYTPSNFGFSYELAGWYTCNEATKYYWNFLGFFFEFHLINERNWHALSVRIPNTLETSNKILTEKKIYRIPIAICFCRWHCLCCCYSRCHFASRQIH